jgi:site-specific recombinase XerD
MAATRPLTEQEEAAVLAALDEFPLRAQCLVEVMMNTGYRISEILSLDVGNVWADGSVRTRVSVERRNLKGGRGGQRRAVRTRTVALNARATAVLERYVFSMVGSAGGPSDASRPLFLSRKGGRLSRNQAGRIIHAVFAAAGVSEAVRGAWGSHVLRKTFTQKIYRATGNDIDATRAVMGHRHVSTTQMYLVVNQMQMDKAVHSIGSNRVMHQNSFAGNGPEWHSKAEALIPQGG